MGGLVLIVDDNERVFQSIEINFHRIDMECVWAGNSADALRMVEGRDFSAALIDLSLGSEDGIELMQRIFKIRPNLPVVMITGFGTLETAVKAIKLGAFDFLPKPLNFGRLTKVLREALRSARGAGPVSASALQGAAGDVMITGSRAMLDLCEKAARIADADVPVLVTGESGTGKELLVELIHRRSARAVKPLVRVNCSAIAETLAESQFFGHAKGAFTGAGREHPGFFEQANGGTLHLDEVGDMPLAIQGKLLRVLEESRAQRLGDHRDVPLDVRIVASTNRDLSDMVRRGTFRQDLFYRLNAVQFGLPPLRDRPEDVPLLVEFFLREFALPNSPPKRFSTKAENALKVHAWPGNIRELKNVVKACSYLTLGGVIEFEDLPAAVREKPTSVSGRLGEAEREVILATLEQVNGNRQLAAQKLGISRRTLYNKLERYGID